MPSVVTSRRLEWLRNQREAAVAEVETLTERAASEDRDLTDVEHSTCVRKRDAVKQYDEEFAVELESCERNAKFEDLAGRVGPALTRTAPQSLPSGPQEDAEPIYRSAGAYLADVLKVRQEKDVDASARLESYRSGLTRAHQVLDNNLAIVPTPVIAPIINDVDSKRPAIDAATRRPMPADGRSFVRPRITQHVAVGVQTAEKTTLESRQLLMSDMTIDKVTYGGYVNLSWQNRDWTNPSVLDIIIADLANAYAMETDVAFCAELTSAVTQTVTASNGATPATADSESWLGAIFDAAALVFAAGNTTPNTIWAAPDVWGALGRLTDSSGRPLFGAIAPQNALGSINAGSLNGNVGGFRLVVDSNFAPGTAILGDSSGVEFYEQVGGTVSALEPTVLGTAVAYWGYAATAVVRPEAFVSITSV